MFGSLGWLFLRGLDTCPANLLTVFGEDDHFQDFAKFAEDLKYKKVIVSNIDIAIKALVTLTPKTVKVHLQSNSFRETVTMPFVLGE